MLPAAPGAAQNFCPGPNREWGLSIPYSSGDTGDLTSSGGAALGIRATGTSHPDTALEVDFQALTSRICSQAGKGEAWAPARPGVWPLWVAEGFPGCWRMSGCQQPHPAGKQDAARPHSSHRQQLRPRSCSYGEQGSQAQNRTEGNQCSPLISTLIGFGFCLHGEQGSAGEWAQRGAQRPPAAAPSAPTGNLCLSPTLPPAPPAPSHGSASHCRCPQTPPCPGDIDQEELMPLAWSPSPGQEEGTVHSHSRPQPRQAPRKLPECGSSSCFRRHWESRAVCTRRNSRSFLPTARSIFPCWGN